MNVLIVYGTYSGGTLETAREIERILKEEGHTITLQNIVGSDSSGKYEFNVGAVKKGIKSHDLVVLGSCTWMEDGLEGQMHSGFKFFDKELKEESFEEIKFAVFGLGDSNYAQFCGAVDNLEKLVKGRRGDLVIPSLRIDKYYTNTKKVLGALKEWTSQIQDSVKTS